MIKHIINSYREVGYDWIEFPTQQHQLLQYSNKNSIDSPDEHSILDRLYSDEVTIDFNNKKHINRSLPLSITGAVNRKLKIGFGISALRNILSTLGLGNLGAKLNSSSFEYININYDDLEMEEIFENVLRSFLFTADPIDVGYNDEPFKRDLEKGIYIYSGVLYATNLQIVLKRKKDFDANINASFRDFVEGKFEVSNNKDEDLIMKSKDGIRMPIALKIHKAEWDKGEFDFKDFKAITYKKNVV